MFRASLALLVLSALLLAVVATRLDSNHVQIEDSDAAFVTYAEFPVDMSPSARVAGMLKRQAASPSSDKAGRPRYWDFIPQLKAAVKPVQYG